MILGKFVHGRPFVVGRVVIPSHDRHGKLQVAVAAIDFLVDSGADSTLLSPVDYEGRLGLSLLSSPLGLMTGGIGGMTQTRIASGYLLLVHENGDRSRFPVTFGIPEPASGQSPLPISLLGRDVLAYGVFTLDIPNQRIALDLPALTEDE